MKGIGSMKRLVMAMSALLVSVTMSFAQESSLHKEPFVVNVGQLVSYLELRPSQIKEVGMSNDYYKEEQSEGLRGSHKMRDKRMRQAVFGNLVDEKGVKHRSISEIRGFDQRNEQ